MYDHLEHHYDMVDMTECAGGKLDGLPESIVSTPGMRGLCRFFLHSSHEDNKPADIADYRNPTLDECQAIHNHTYDAYLAVYMLLSLYLSIYGKLIEDLPNYYSMGIDQYPQTRAKMHDTIAHWQNRAARYGLHALPRSVVFAQDND